MQGAWNHYSSRFANRVNKVFLQDLKHFPCTPAEVGRFALVPIQIVKFLCISFQFPPTPTPVMSAKRGKILLRALVDALC